MNIATIYIILVLIFSTLVKIFNFKLSPKLTLSFRKLYLFLISNFLSMYEILLFFGCVFFGIVFLIFVALLSDDIIESIFVLVFIFVFFGFLGLVFGLNPLKQFFGFTPTTASEPLKKFLITDLINYLLCLVRIFMC